MIKRLQSFACLSVALLAGCAIHQTVHPLDAIGDKQVCVIDNPRVRPNVLADYRRILTNKGYAVRLLPETAAITDCRITSTFVASWRWDLALYMHYAEFRVFVDGKEKGVAIYDATRGGANPGKFIDADNKIAELINQLFPGGAGLPVDAAGATTTQ